MNKEAREVALLPVNPGTVNEEDVMSNSMGKSVTEVSVSWAKNDGKALPRYLRSSTGSCHDFCKYGKKHASASMGKKHTFRRFSGSNANLEKAQDGGNIASLADSRKKSVIEQKASAHPETGVPIRTKLHVESHFTPVNTGKSSKQSEIGKQNSQHFTENEGSCQGSIIIECDVPSPSTKIKSLEGSETIKQIYSESIEFCDAPEAIKPKASSLLTEASGDAKTGNKQQSSINKMNLPLEPTPMEQRPHSAKKASVSTKTKIQEKVPSPLQKVIPSLKHKVSKVEASSPAKRSNVSERPALFANSMIKNLMPLSALNSTRGTRGRRSGSKIAMNADISELSDKKTLRPPSSASLYPKTRLSQFSNSTTRTYKNIKSSFPLKHTKTVGKMELETDKVKERMLYAIEPRPAENENFNSSQLDASSGQQSHSPSPSSSSSLLSSCPSVSDHDEEELQNSTSASSKASDSVSAYAEDRIGKVVEKENKKIHRRAATVHTEGRDPTPQKLKFRRGKMVSPQSDNNGPRRLRFRQGRRMGDNQSCQGEVRKESFSRKESAYRDLDLSTLDAQTVVLRHQDVQDKKDTQGLFNHVIEEAASKLVESRKSKVKALVGAFETVISLQERKPVASV